MLRFFQIILLSFYLFLQFIGCKESEELPYYTISGQIYAYPEGKVNLEKFEFGERILIDSLFMTKGKFKFKLAPDAPEQLYVLNIDDEKILIEFFFNKNNVKILADFETGTSQIFGSDLHNEYLLLLENCAIFENRQRSIDEQLHHAYANNDTISLRSLSAMKKNVEDEQIDFIRSYIKEHRSSHVSLYAAASVLQNSANLHEINLLLKLFKDSLHSSVYYKELEFRKEVLKNTQLGVQVPDFSMSDTSGTPLSLSSFQGKNLVLRFAASWHAASVEEIKQLHTIFDKNKNDEIVFLELGAERDLNEWKKYITKNKINWYSFSDLKGTESTPFKTFGIKKIPSYYLLDKKGVILKRDFSINELEEYLNELP